MAISPDAWMSAVAGCSGVLIGSGIVGLVIKGKFAAVETLTRDLTSLKDERVKGIEDRMRTFEGACQVKHDRLADTLNRVERMAADLSNMVGWTRKLDAKLDGLADASARAGAHIDAQDKWLGNLDASHQSHVRDREIHNGR